MKVLIVGAGISGFGAAKLLRLANHDVRISEQKQLANDDRSSYENLGVTVLDGGHELAHLDGIELLVASPGLPPSHLLLKESEKRGIPVVSEIDLAMRGLQKTVFGVTGTNGKSTTVALIDHGLKNLGFTSVPCGNFGDPPSLILAENRLPDNLVLELSSYQLEQSNAVHVDCSMITSFSCDHLARHGTEKSYFASKWKLIELAKPNTPVLLSSDVANATINLGWSIPKGAYVIGETSFPDVAGIQRVAINGHDVSINGKTSFRLKSQYLKGPHNLRNLAFAVLGIHLVKKTPFDEVVKALSDYRGLPHRCALVGTFAGRDVFNDSKSTNVESTLVALQAMTGKVILMMGGIGKGEPYGPILAEKDKIAALLTFGPTGPEIAAALKDSLPVQNFPTLASLFAGIDGIIEKYQYPILFSPGCASFDEFRNFAHRGEYFTNQISQAFAAKNANKRNNGN
jgi:UDP-N-acetylmuramoylalanine--D-glutamate ligase